MPLTPDNLQRLTGTLPVPRALRALAGRPDLHRKIPSVTACYLDLGDHLAASSDGGSLLHILSDQQSVCHWLLYLDDEGHEAVLSSTEPVGIAPFDAPVDPTAVVDIEDGFVLTADTFVEFLVRFWLENELWLAITRQEPLPPVLADYAAQLRATV